MQRFCFSITLRTKSLLLRISDYSHGLREEREGRLPPPPPIREGGAPTTGDDASHLHHQNPTQRSPPPANATTTDFWAVRHCPTTKIKSIRLPKRIGHHSGFAFVEFGTKQEANNAIQALSSTHLYGRHLVLERAKERESLEDLRARTASQFSDRQDGMSSIMPLFICRGQWREPSVVNDYMGSLDGGAYQEKYSGNSRAGMRSTTKFYGNDECNG